MPQGDILEDDFLVSAAGQGDRAQEQQYQFEHALIVACVAGKINASARTDRILANQRPVYSLTSIGALDIGGGNGRGRHSFATPSGEPQRWVVPFISAANSASMRTSRSSAAFA